MNIIKPVSEHDLFSAAELVFIADKEYYSLFQNKSEVIENIVKMYSDERTDFSVVKSIYIDNNMIGIIIYYPLSELKLRQMFSLQYLVKDDMFSYDVLKEFNEKVPVIKGDGIYLSRLAIKKEYQGMGLCEKILTNFEKTDTLMQYNKIVLHVHKSNIYAKKCYQSNGYDAQIVTEEFNYIAMKKTITSN